MGDNETVIVDSEPVYDLEIKDNTLMSDDDRSTKNDLEIKDESFMFSDLCRFCTNPKGEEGRNIFGSDEPSKEIYEMINLVFPNKIHEEDGLTHFICLECVDKLRQCYEILVVFVAADTYFKHQLTEITMKNYQENTPSVKDNTSNCFYDTEISSVENNQDFTNPEDLLVIKKNDTSKNVSPLQKRKKLILVRKNQNRKKCSLCSKVFSSIQTLTIHRRNVHRHRFATQKENHFQCPNCPIVHTKLQALLLHIKCKYLRVRNQSKIHVCHDCGLSFKRKYLLRAHKRESHKNYVCTTCGEAFTFPNLLAIHVHKEHRNTTCSVCGKKFKTSYWRIMHEKTHETDNCHLCWVCGKVCISKGSLRIHMALHYSSKSYTCDVCNKELKSASGLKHHKQIHTDRERIFKCNICEKAFTSKVILKQHGLSHSGLKPYACTNCGTQFNRLSNLNYHIKHYCAQKKPVKTTRRAVNPAYQCEVCKSTFVSKLSFKYHMSRHTGNKTPFDCEECGLAFSSVSSFRQHKREHTLVYRPYVCETCGKTFKNKASLTTHSSTHSNLYPYTCSECNRAFKRLSSLKVHQSVHSGGKPYRCGICYRAFTRKGDAKSHLSRCHKVDVKAETEEVELKYSEIVLDSNDLESFPVIAGEYVIQMADDVEVETSYETIQ